MKVQDIIRQQKSNIMFICKDNPSLLKKYNDWIDDQSYDLYTDKASPEYPEYYVQNCQETIWELERVQKIVEKYEAVETVIKMIKGVL